MRRRALAFLVFLALAFAFVLPAYAGIEQLSEEEFRSLSAELAPKVNLFRDAWEQDPDAVFYGGTSRDYLYWIKGKFLHAKTRSQALAVKKQLEALPSIDVRDFIIGESDVDVVSENGAKLKAAQYGVRKIDSITTDVFDPSTELGQNELWQGHVPVEKVQIASQGIRQNPALGDGLKEIYTGKLTVHYADPAKFAETKFAREGVNHQVLLALRYLRLQGINYFKTYGGGLPNKDLIFSGFDEKSRAETKKVIDQALDGKELIPYLKQGRFKSWLNGTIQKSFRSYTNPTAALEILKAFDVDKFSTMYGADNIESLNQYVFAKHRDQAAIAAAMKSYSVDENKFFEDPASRFSNGFLYHGTKDERSFRSILFQGVLPSEKGVGEKGLYGVALHNKTFSENWGGDKNRLIQFPVKPNARIVDVTKGEGERVFHAFGQKEDAFAEAFGVDIVRYPYGTEAFVVKNSESLGQPQGVYRKLATFSELLERSRNIRDANELLDTIKINSFSTRESAEILNASPISEGDFVKVIEAQLKNDPNELVKVVAQSDIWKKYGPNYTEALLASGKAEAGEEAVRLLSNSLERTDLWKKFGSGLVDKILKIERAPDPDLFEKYGMALLNLKGVTEPIETPSAIKAAVQLLGRDEFPITQTRLYALLHSQNHLAAKKAMGLLAEGKFPYDDKTIALMARDFSFENSGQVVLESLLAQKKWDVLAKVAEKVKKDHPSLGAYECKRYLIFVNQIHAGEMATIDSEEAGVTRLARLVEKYLLPGIEPQMVAPLKRFYAEGEVPVHTNITSSKDFDPIIRPFREQAAEYPELFDGVLEGYLKELKILKPQELLQLTKNFKPGWSSDPKSLRLIKRAVAKDPWQRESLRLFGQMLVPLLTVNGPWEKDLGFFTEVMQNAQFGDNVSRFRRLLETPGLAANNRALELITIKALNLPVQIPPLLAYYSTEEMADHPQTLIHLAKSHYLSKQLLPVLKNPVWARSPETLEAFARVADADELREWHLPTIQDLLDLPHWRDNPAFADLKKDGKINEADFTVYVKKKYSLGTRLGKFCSGFFGKLTGN